MKKLAALFTIGALLVTASSSVFADENGGTETSTATVSFQANTKPTDPVDPWNPDEPGTEPGTGMDGPLSLDFVPNIAFGTQTITGKVETYKSTSSSPYIQVSDTRGNHQGWTVNVTLGAFESATPGVADITDAMLTFKNGGVATNSDNTATAPTSTSEIKLSAGVTDAKTALHADINQGEGTWIQTWLAASKDAELNDNVTLQIDTAKASPVAYSADITWTLSVNP